MYVEVGAQAAIFGQGMLLGVLLGVIYDGMRAARRSIHLRALAFALDLLFWLGVIAALFALTLLRDNGQVQIYHMAAFLLGGGLYFATASRLVLPVLLWAAELVVFDRAGAACGAGRKKSFKKPKKRLSKLAGMV